MQSTKGVLPTFPLPRPQQPPGEVQAAARGVRIAAYSGPPAEDVSHVIVVGGPGRTAFTALDQRGVAGDLSDRVENCQLIVNDCGVPHTEQPVKQGLLNALATTANVRTLVYLQAHGDFKGNGFAINLDGDVWVPINTLFKAIGESRKAPVDIFMATCHGGAALHYAHLLPTGSVVVALSPDLHELSGAGIDRLRDDMPRICGVSAFGLLLTYCGLSMKAGRNAPSLCMPDGSTLSLGRSLASLQGRPFPSEDKVLVHQQLDGLVGATRVNEGIATVEAGTFIHDIDFGLALAIAAVLGGVRTAKTNDVQVFSDPTEKGVPQAPVDCGLPSELPAISGHGRVVINVLGTPVAWPQLRIEHPGVADMFARRGNTVALSNRSRGSWGSLPDQLLLNVSGEDTVVVSFFQRPRDGSITVTKIIEASPRAIAVLQEDGVLSEGEIPTPSTNKSHQLPEPTQRTQIQPPSNDDLRSLLEGLSLLYDANLPAAQPKTKMPRAQLRLEHPGVADMFARRGDEVALSHRSKGRCTMRADMLFLEVSGQVLMLEFAGQPSDGSVTVTSIEGSLDAIEMLRQDGVLTREEDPG